MALASFCFGAFLWSLFTALKTATEMRSGPVEHNLRRAAAIRTSVARRVGRARMKRSTGSRGAFAMRAALPLLPVCGNVLRVLPVIVFFMEEEKLAGAESGIFP